jgi:hypothetical protein
MLESSIIERRRSEEAMSKPKSPIRHGWYGTYAHGCRCEPCRQAWKAYQKPRNYGHKAGPRTDAEQDLNRRINRALEQLFPADEEV